MSLTFLIRGLFLSLLFPKLMVLGRCWMSSSRDGQDNSTDSQQQQPTENDILGSWRFGTEEEFYEQVEPDLLSQKGPGHDDLSGPRFNLLFVKISLFMDGLLTMTVAFANRSSHMYIGLFSFLKFPGYLFKHELTATSRLSDTFGIRCCSCGKRHHCGDVASRSRRRCLGSNQPCRNDSDTSHK